MNHQQKVGFIGSTDKAAFVWKRPPTFKSPLYNNGIDLALLRFEIMRHEGGRQRRSSNVCGEYTIAACNVREGYRVVPLVSSHTGELLDGSFIFAKFHYNLTGKDG